MRARIESGWVVVDCSAPDTVHVYIALGQPTNWRPAYRDWAGTQRTAKVRATGTGRVEVWLKIGSAVSSAGRVNL